MKIQSVVVVALCVVGLVPGPASPSIYAVSIPDNNITFVADTLSGHGYSVVSFVIPPEIPIKRLNRAILEFHADVSASEIEGWLNETPLVEVIPLPAGTTFDPGSARSTMVKNVIVGQDRVIRIDVTKGLRTMIQDPRAEPGFAIGSFRGTREGSFGILGGGGARTMKIRILCDDIHW